MDREATASVSLRNAAPADAGFIWQLRNAPDVRAVSRRRHELEWREFEREIVSAIADPEADVLVVQVDREAAGYVRINLREGHEFELGLALDPRFRGRGLGSAAIGQATLWFLAAHPDATLIALVAPGNTSSVRAFEAAGYVRAGNEGELVVYRSPAP